MKYVKRVWRKFYATLSVLRGFALNFPHSELSFPILFQVFHDFHYFMCCITVQSDVPLLLCDIKKKTSNTLIQGNWQCKYIVQLFLDQAQHTSEDVAGNVLMVCSLLYLVSCVCYFGCTILFIHPPDIDHLFRWVADWTHSAISPNRLLLLSILRAMILAILHIHTELYMW